MVLLDDGDDLIDAATPFLAHVHASHESRESLVPRTGRLVDEAKGIDQGQAGVGNLHPGLEKFDHRPRPREVEILMNEGIGDQFFVMVNIIFWRLLGKIATG